MSTDNKHTAGQWKAIDMKIYSMFSQGTAMGHKIQLATVDGASDEATANAQLMASSKELLEALKEIVIDINSGMLYTARNRAKAAIQKATNNHP